MPDKIKLNEGNLTQVEFNYEVNRKLSINLGDVEIATKPDGTEYVRYINENIVTARVPFVFSGVSMMAVINQAVRMTKTDFQNMIRGKHKNKELVRIGVYEAREWWDKNIESHKILIGQGGEQIKAPMTLAEILEHIKSLPVEEREEAKKRIKEQLG